jgi:Restriction Enzyme Adenine Methylase Associated
VLTPGMMLFPARKKYGNKVATLLPDGQVEVDGVAYASPSDAATAVVGKRTGGWWFFLTDQASRMSLRKIRRDYVNTMAVDEEDDEPDDDEDEEA